MVKALLFIILLLFNSPVSFHGLSAQGQDISRHEADSLLGSLSKAGADTAPINSLLKLATFEIHKPGEFKTDLDSAAVFIDQAKQINNKIRSIEAHGYITLIESYLEKERSQKKDTNTSSKTDTHSLTNAPYNS